MRRSVLALILAVLALAIQSTPASACGPYPFGC